MSTFNPIFYYNTITAASEDPYLANQIAYYPFNTNANDLINAYNGTSTNIVYTNSGIVSTSATFNGTSSLITLPDNNDFSFGVGAFSINMWIYPVGAGGYLISKRSTTAIEYQMTYDNTISRIFFTCYGSNSNSIFIQRSVTTTLTLNTWSMVTVTFLGGTNPIGFKIYKNGVLLTGANGTTGAYTGMTNTTAPIALGRQGNNAGTWLNARLDQTRFWKGRELTQSEITYIYNTLY